MAASRACQQPSTESSSGEWLIYEFDVLGETPPPVKLRYRAATSSGLTRGRFAAAMGAP